MSIGPAGQGLLRSEKYGLEIHQSLFLSSSKISSICRIDASWMPHIAYLVIHWNAANIPDYKTNKINLFCIYGKVFLWNTCFLFLVFTGLPCIVFVRSWFCDDNCCLWEEMSPQGATFSSERNWSRLNEKEFWLQVQQSLYAVDFLEKNTKIPFVN
jgi:hypothetical protein